MVYTSRKMNFEAKRMLCVDLGLQDFRNCRNFEEITNPLAILKFLSLLLSHPTSYGNEE